MSTSTLTPKYHWTFAEIKDSITTDTVSQATAQVSNVVMSGQGRIGNAIALDGSSDSYISFGRGVGQFGQENFTVAFGVKIASGTKGLELLGNRTTDSHGNFFTIRVSPEERICVEIDEDSSGKNYLYLNSSPKINDGTWHHIAVVRQQNELRLYIDGNLSEKKSASGVANVANGNELRTGKVSPSFLAPPKAEYEDLRIYDFALSDAEILALVPPIKSGEIELATADGIIRIWSLDTADLSAISTTFTKLRLGAGTGATLYKEPNYQGTFQEIPSDVPNLSMTRLEASPKSFRIWSSSGKPFTGKWAILAPNGQYLSLMSLNAPSLTTSPCVTAYEQFDFRFNLEHQGLQLIPGTSYAWDKHGFGIATNAGLIHGLFCVEEDQGFRRFSLINEQGDRWLAMVPSNRIVLRTLSGKYLRAEPDGGKNVFADRDYPLSDEMFELISLEGDRIALKTRNGSYFSAQNNTQGNVVANVTHQQSWETFILHKVDEQKQQFGFKAIDTNKFISANNGGGGQVYAKHTWCSTWETFIKLNLGAFDWTTEKEQRAIFTRAIKLAENESQVGELLPGEVAFYKDPPYRGNTVILYSGCDDFRAIENFNDTISSVRLGPATGATLYVNPGYDTSQNPETDVMDLVEDIPDLISSQIGNDKLSAVKIWSNVTPKQANLTFSTSLSQDYKLVGEEFQDVSSYRTILKFLPEVTKVEVWATDQTVFEVDGEHYEVNEDQCVELVPNGMSRIMITSEAEGINTPGLKIRTNTMQSHERVVIFPDREAHQQLADLNENALWNAKDANGKLLVNQEEYTAAEVASVQQTVAKTMKTLSYVTVDDEDDQLIDLEISADAIEKPWQLSFRGTAASGFGDGARILVARKEVGNTSNANTSSTSTQITEQELGEDDFARLLEQTSGSLAQGFSLKNAFRQIKDAVKNATSVAVGVAQNVATGIVNAAKKVADIVKQVVAVVVDAAGRAVQFVIDTAEKAAAFVEGVVEKIGVAAKRLAEYLRSLFNWDDILVTQQMLASRVEQGFNLAEQAAIVAIQPVNNLVDTVKNAVNSGLDETLNRLRKDTEKIDQQPKLPEALEWLLSKLTSNDSSFSDTTKAVSPSPDETDPVAAFFSTFKSSSKAVVDMLLTGLAGMGKTIALLIAAPTQPQFAVIALLEMIKDVVNTAFDFIKGIAEAFLKCIASAIGRFRSLINAEINIPFITAFVKKVLKIDKFNLLNLTTLLLAIPVTVTYKLLAGSEAKLALSQTASIQGWMVTGFIADTINGLVTSLLDATFIENLGFEVVSTLLQFFSWMSSFPDSPDFDGGRPYDVASYQVTETQNPAEYWERVMWGWRSFALGVDVVALLVAKTRIKRAFNKKDPKKVEVTVDGTMPVLAMLFAAIDLGITTKYLVTSLNANAEAGDSRATKTHKESIRQSGEYIAIFPSFFAFLNYGNIQSKLLALGAIDLVCAGVVSGLKGDEMRRDFKSA